MKIPTVFLGSQPAPVRVIDLSRAQPVDEAKERQWKECFTEAIRIGASHEQAEQYANIEASRPLR